MRCVVCLRNGASIVTFMCPYCANVPAFQHERNRVDASIIKKFKALSETKQAEIIKLTNLKLNQIVKMNLRIYNSDNFNAVVADFSLKNVIKDYVELVQLGLDIRMKLKKDRGWATRITYTQYSAPIREEQ